MKICFVIRDLGCGGAERQLVLLANELAKRGNEVLIATFYSGGVREQDVCPTVRLIDLAKRSPRDVLGVIWKLNRLVREERPDIVHGYLSAGNLGAACTRLLNWKTRVFWGIRDSDMKAGNYGLISRFSTGAARRLSFLAHRVVLNSRAGLEHNARLGYPRRKLLVIPNGIDTDIFRPDPDAGDRVRKEWGFSAEQKLVGVIGRLDPMKDHAGFLKAAGIVKRKIPEARFICIGSGPAAMLEALNLRCSELGLEKDVRWVPSRNDMRAVHNALDVVCSSSCYGEGFPNVVGEAMACARRCVVTDIGDSAEVVGNVGAVVPPSDPGRLAAAIIEQLQLPPHAPEARLRICENFGVPLLANRSQAAMLAELPQHTRHTVAAKSWRRL